MNLIEKLINEHLIKFLNKNLIKSRNINLKKKNLIKTRIADVVDSAHHGRAHIGTATFEVAVEEDPLLDTIRNRWIAAFSHGEASLC